MHIQGCKCIYKAVNVSKHHERGSCSSHSWKPCTKVIQCGEEFISTGFVQNARGKLKSQTSIVECSMRNPAEWLFFPLCSLTYWNWVLSDMALRLQSPQLKQHIRRAYTHLYPIPSYKDLKSSTNWYRRTPSRSWLDITSQGQGKCGIEEMKHH